MNSGKMKFSGNCLPTTIGSLPHVDAKESTQLMLRYTPRIPAWVQMPKLSKEGMLVQFSEGIPGLVFKEGKLSFLNEGQEFEDALLKFYEEYLFALDGTSIKDLKRFAISLEYASGLYALFDLLGSIPTSLDAIKCQITGPFTLGTGLTDKTGRYAYYDPTLKDIIVKSLSLKAKWQISKFKPFGVPVIVSIDEPSLVGYGSSAFISVTKDDIQKSLEEIIGVIHLKEGIAATHCCENTDWALLLETGIDIISFDAYGFFDNIIIYENELKKFIERGGIIAWGIVPTHDTDVLSSETVDSLMSRWLDNIQRLTAKGIDFNRLLRQSLITPSCGAGSLSLELAEKALALTKDLSEKIIREYL
jgi:methionine synthase II (cobalamin-independent)